MWIAQRVTELLGIEDDVLIAYIYEQLEGHKVLAVSTVVGRLVSVGLVEPLGEC